MSEVQEAKGLAGIIECALDDFLAMARGNPDWDAIVSRPDGLAVACRIIWGRLSTALGGSAGEFQVRSTFLGGVWSYRTAPFGIAVVNGSKNSVFGPNPAVAGLVLDLGRRSWFRTSPFWSHDTLELRPEGGEVTLRPLEGTPKPGKLYRVSDHRASIPAFGVVERELPTWLVGPKCAFTEVRSDATSDFWWGLLALLRQEVTGLWLPPNCDSSLLLVLGSLAPGYEFLSVDRAGAVTRLESLLWAPGNVHRDPILFVPRAWNGDLPRD